MINRIEAIRESVSDEVEFMIVNHVSDEAIGKVEDSLTTLSNAIGYVRRLGKGSKRNPKQYPPAKRVDEWLSGLAEYKAFMLDMFAELGAPKEVVEHIRKLWDYEPEFDLPDQADKLQRQTARLREGLARQCDVIEKQLAGDIDPKSLAFQTKGIAKRLRQLHKTMLESGEYQSKLDLQAALRAMNKLVTDYLIADFDEQGRDFVDAIASRMQEILDDASHPLYTVK